MAGEPSRGAQKSLGRAQSGRGTPGNVISVKVAFWGCLRDIVTLNRYYGVTYHAI